MMPFGHVFSMPPIKLSRIQFRLAIELAAQQAAQAELRRQLAKQTGTAASDINVDGATVDFRIQSDPEILIEGIPIPWVD